MATQAEKFEKTGSSFETPAQPDLPRIPQKIKDRFPDLKPEWEKFEEDLHRFFRESHFRQQNL